MSRNNLKHRIDNRTEKEFSDDIEKYQSEEDIAANKLCQSINSKLGYESILLDRIDKNQNVQKNYINKGDFYLSIKDKNAKIAFSKNKIVELKLVNSNSDFFRLKKHECPTWVKQNETLIVISRYKRINESIGIFSPKDIQNIIDNNIIVSDPVYFGGKPHYKLSDKNIFFNFRKTNEIYSDKNNVKDFLRYLISKC